MNFGHCEICSKNQKRTTDTSFVPPLKIYCRVLQNQYTGGTKDVIRSKKIIRNFFNNCSEPVFNFVSYNEKSFLISTLTLNFGFVFTPGHQNGHNELLAI
ncbi:hypothetical protein BpHYR1_036784 [Brachionus plicatilis]|uniref:Uncharacterized protein n=1 Tax=Brachionus plicatilis TaxID=10195 RepID=A0A3M7PRS7_BRAPC|nr:hypothetical protein BpHYR1_036784 [Brachionus plicatilis]